MGVSGNMRMDSTSANAFHPSFFVLGSLCCHEKGVLHWFAHALSLWYDTTTSSSLLLQVSICVARLLALLKLRPFMVSSGARSFVAERVTH